jgi:hypothetical protein
MISNPSSRVVTRKTGRKIRMSGFPLLSSNSLKLR